MFPALSRNGSEVLRTQALSLGHISLSSCRSMYCSCPLEGYQTLGYQTLGYQTVFASHVWIAHCEQKGELLKATAKHGPSHVQRLWSLARGKKALPTEGSAGTFHPCRLETTICEAASDRAFSESIPRLGDAWLCFHRFPPSSCCPGGICSQKGILLLILGQSS